MKGNFFIFENKGNEIFIYSPALLHFSPSFLLLSVNSGTKMHQKNPILYNNSGIIFKALGVDSVGYRNMMLTTEVAAI